MVVPGSLKLRPCGSTATIHLVKPPDGFDESYDGSDLVDHDGEEGEGDEDDDGDGDGDDYKLDRQRHVETSAYKTPVTGKGRKKRASRDKEGVDKARLEFKSFGLQTAVTDEAEDIVWYG